MLIPLDSLGQELVATHCDLPGKVAGQWGPKYGLNVEELAAELTVELCAVAARLLVVKMPTGQIICPGEKQNPRNYLYSALRRRIVDLLQARQREPDLIEYGQVQARLRPSPPTPLGVLIEEEEEWGFWGDFAGPGGGMVPQGGHRPPA